MKTASPSSCTNVQGSTPIEQHDITTQESGKKMHKDQQCKSSKLTKLLLKLPFMVRVQVECLIMDGVNNL